MEDRPVWNSSTTVLPVRKRAQVPRLMKHTGSVKIPSNSENDPPAPCTPPTKSFKPRVAVLRKAFTPTRPQLVEASSISSPSQQQIINPKTELSPSTMSPRQGRSPLSTVLKRRLIRTPTPRVIVSSSLCKTLPSSSDSSSSTPIAVGFKSRPVPSPHHQQSVSFQSRQVVPSPASQRIQPDKQRVTNVTKQVTVRAEQSSTTAATAPTITKIQATITPSFPAIEIVTTNNMPNMDVNLQTPTQRRTTHKKIKGSPTTIQRHTLNQKFMDSVQLDVSKWIARLVPEFSYECDLFEQLSTGVVLWKLLLVIRSDIGSKMQPNIRAARGSFFARDNVALFTTNCKKILDPIVLFEVGDLVDEKNTEGVLRCIMALSREGAKYGIMPPEVVQVEDEVDKVMAQAEANLVIEEPPVSRTNAPYQPVQNDDIDTRVAKLQALHPHLAGRLTRISHGTYWLHRKDGCLSKRIFVRVLFDEVVVRVGGGWEDILSFSLRYQ